MLVSAGVRWQPFSAAAAAELPPVADPAAWAVPAAEAAARRDLRGPEFLVASVDPPGALRPVPRCQQPPLMCVWANVALPAYPTPARCFP